MHRWQAEQHLRNTCWTYTAYRENQEPHTCSSRYWPTISLPGIKKKKCFLPLTLSFPFFWALCTWNHAWRARFCQTTFTHNYVCEQLARCSMELTRFHRLRGIPFVPVSQKHFFVLTWQTFPTVTVISSVGKCFHWVNIKVWDYWSRQVASMWIDAAKHSWLYLFYMLGEMCRGILL